MSSRHTVTGKSGGRPAHAARPGLPAARTGVILAALGALITAGWVGAVALLKSTGPTTTTPVSASRITVSPSPSP